eukprot:NODE_3_length_80033_cov_0.932970.p70 type:complete len:119 gc:universal NODE_3_length_80033_cov_0.932970:56339-55983(-)
MKLKVSSINPSSVFEADRFMVEEESCWYSDSGETQYITLHFEESRTISKVIIQYQGGFGALDVNLRTLDNSFTFQTEDSGIKQYLSLSNPIQTQKIKVTFSNLSDLYGRLILYNLNFE